MVISFQPAAMRADAAPLCGSALRGKLARGSHLASPWTIPSPISVRSRGCFGARGRGPAALELLVPLVYEDLRRLARLQLGHEFGERTLNATALVHESYLKLGAGAFAATDRAHFLAIAARAMRQVLVDHARDRKAAKRGGGSWERTTLTDGAWVAGVRS